MVGYEVNQHARKDGGRDKPFEECAHNTFGFSESNAKRPNDRRNNADAADKHGHLNRT